MTRPIKRKVSGVTRFVLYFKTINGVEAYVDRSNADDVGRTNN
jgi:hypothetical protein